MASGILICFVLNTIPYLPLNDWPMLCLHVSMKTISYEISDCLSILNKFCPQKLVL